MNAPCQAETLLIEGPAGVLETRVACPRQPRAPATAALICHPHPLYGGNMDNKVVYTLAAACTQLGAVSVRFNFRGVGRSGGAYAQGLGETEDAQAVAEWVRARYAPVELWLAGFSFGAFVALRARSVMRAARLVLVAPPVNRFTFDMQLDALPTLVIQGDADSVVDPAAVRAWATGQAHAPDYHVLRGAEHFFHGRLSELRDILTAWLHART